MNAMNLMKALGDIPEDLVKSCFDEKTAEHNTTIPSDSPDSDVSNPIIQYQAENTDEKHDFTPKISAHNLRYLKYFFTFAACLLIIVGPPLIISQLKNKPSITPVNPVVPTQSQKETETQPLVTATNEVNTSAKNTNTTITTAITTSKMSDSTTVSKGTASERQTTTKTQAEIKAHETVNTIPNVIQSIQQTEEISSENTQVPTHTEQHIEHTQSIPNDNSYNSVITIQMPDELYQKMLDFHMYASRNAETTFYWYNKTYKVEYTQKLSDHVFYSVQKLSSGGLFYAFWQGSDTDNAILSHTAVADRRLSLSDFDGININDTYEEVEQIEPTTKYWIENFRDRRNYQELYKQRIILTDGLLVISYETENGNFIISDLAYYDNYTENVPDMQFPNEKELALNYEYRILLDDYPN